MEGATHFIEVYKSGHNENLQQTSATVLFRLYDYLKQTEELETLTTIAIFKIKLKPQPHGQLHS